MKDLDRPTGMVTAIGAFALARGSPGQTEKSGGAASFVVGDPA